MRCIFVRLATGGLLASVLLACSPLTEQQLYEREVRLIEAKEEYLAKEAYCTKMGGMMEMRTKATALTRKADYFYFRSARCVRR